MLIYICSPYGGKDINVKLARDLMRYAMRKGHTPIAPHVLYHGTLNDCVPEQRTIGLASAMNLLMRCDQVWMPEWTEKTSGMLGEQAMAIKMKIPIKLIGKLDFLNAMIQKDKPEEVMDEA